MSQNSLGKMPRLQFVDPDVRQKIFTAVERIDKSRLERAGAWARIQRALPGAILQNVDAEPEAVFQDADTQEYLILADVSVLTAGGSSDSVSTTISAVKLPNSEIAVNTISVNLPDSDAAAEQL
jgi:hypothetical protein